MASGKRPPALGQRLKPEPQVGGVERPRIVPAGDIRIKAVAVSGFSGLRLVAQDALHGTFNPAHRGVSLSRKNFPAFGCLQEFRGLFAEQALCLSFQARLVLRVNRIHKLRAGIPGHHVHVHAFPLPVQCDRIAHAEDVVLHRKERHMRFHIFLIAALQLHRVQGPRFLQGLHAQVIKKVLAFLFRVPQQFRPADFPAEIRIKDHCAHHNGVAEQSGVVRACHLGHHASAAGGLAGNGNLFRVSAEGCDVPLHPAQSGLLVQVAEIGRGVRLLRGNFRMRQESQRANPVVNRHNHDSAPGDPLPVKLHLRRISALQPAAEEPYQHRLLLIRALRVGPHIQVQAVLTHRNLRVHMPFPAVDVRPESGNPLHGNRRKAVAFLHTVPVFAGLRCTPAVPADRRCGKGDSLECCNPRICRFNSAHPSVFCFHLSQHS